LKTNNYAYFTFLFKKSTFCKLRICAVFILGSFFGLSAQGYWVQKAGGPTADEGYSISLDDSNNTYTTGYFTGTAAFGGTNLTALGVSDVFVTKTNSNGVFKWAVKGGDGGSDRGLAIKTDSKGNSYVTGYYYGTAKFGTFSITSAGLQDVFVVKYDRNGNVKWLVSAGGTQSDIGNGITVDNNGDVIITGQFAGVATFGTFTLTSTTNNINVFTAKLDSATGNFIWAKSGVGAHTDRGLAVACDASNNVYVTGQFSDTITFDFPAYSPFYDAIFIVKYNSAGVEQWFTKAGGATMNIANAIAVDNSSNVYITGNFTGTLTFYALNTTATLTNLYTNRIFLAKYDQNSNLTWDVADGSSNAVNSNSIGLDGSGNPYIIGNFECIMNGYADHYGQGTFNAVGGWDIFTSEYSSSAGAWQWSRQIGGHGNNYGYGITVSTSGDIYTTGSFDQDMIVTADPFPSFLGYNAISSNCNSTYCSDSWYGYYEYLNTAGNLDIFIGKPINLNRQPYDFYLRTGSGCNRPQVGVCIGESSVCMDTVQFCLSGSITAIPLSCPTIGPTYTYLWSTHSSATTITVSTTGWYYVTQTSTDGCFVSKDSIYVIIHPDPPQPCLSDSKGINTNSTNPKTIRICNGPVTLTGCNYSSDSTWYWTTPNSSKIDSVKITVGLRSDSGYYCFTVVDSFGCVNQTCVWVAIDSALPPIIPKIKCLTCKHDTAFMCKGGDFTLFPYDSISNPHANTTLCIPPQASTTNKWIASPNSLSYALTTNCPDQNSFTPTDSGWYDITDTIVRSNACGTSKNILKDSIFVRLYPLPVVTLTINGNTSVCPGDSEWIVASGNTNSNFSWSNGNTIDSIYVGPGYYYASASLTNSYGCTGTAAAGITINIATIPSPNVIMIPSSGVVCPNDSVELKCIGGPYQNYQWYGPSGPLSADDSIVYVKNPGSYYCYAGDSLPCPISKLTNTVITQLYATPYLALPSNLNLCPGDSIDVNVVASSDAVIQWLPPLSGDSASQTIKTAGTYSVQVISCGITTICTVTITSSTPYSVISVSPSKTLCNAGDSILLSADTGMAQYIWTPGNTSGLTIFVKNAGTYTLTAFDSHGCSATSDVVISPPVKDSVASYVNISCKGGNSGSITLNVTGGAPTYTYSWSPPEGSGATASNLSAGTYTATVTDANGCTKTVAITLTQPATLLASTILSSSNVNCYGNSNGIATVAATGGVPTYTYLWNPGGQTAPMATGLSVGTYTVVVSDMAGCSVTSTINITQPNAINSTSLSTAASCANNDGTITLSTSGGTSPFTYLWTPGGYSGSTISGLSSGRYSVTITDANGCIDTTSVVVAFDSTFSLVLKGIDTACKGLSVVLTASGASDYLWSNGSTYDTITVYPTSTSTYWVVGSTGICKDSIAHTISIYKPLAASMPRKDTICPGMPVSLRVITTGGKAPYTYVWNNGITSNGPGTYVVYPKDSTTYIVTVTDGCNDVITDSTRIDVLPHGNASFTVSPDTIPGGQTINFTNTSKNTTQWYWTFGNGSSSDEFNPSEVYINPGVYQVVLISYNSYGCPDTATKDVYVTPEIYIPNVFTPNGDGQNDVFYFTITGTTCFHCNIYNRWGVLVYELNSVAQGWPGIIRQTEEPASDGTYYYIINYCDYKGASHNLDGFITLIRNK
jgi:gliding motility-associated-like protein